MNQTQTVSGRPDGRKTKRRRMLGKAHILWKELRPDLAFSNDERRQELLHYACTVLDLPELISLSDLTDGKLGKLLDALAREISSPRLPGQTIANKVSNLKSQISNSPSPVRGGMFIEAAAGTDQSPGRGGIERPADIHHLASEQQVWAINKIFGHLRWSTEARSAFLEQRFKRKSPAFLTPRQANSLISILLTIAASAEIKKEAADRGQPIERVSRAMAQSRFHQLKKALGIGQVVR